MHLQELENSLRAFNNIILVIIFSVLHIYCNNNIIDSVVVHIISFICIIIFLVNLLV